MKSYRNIIIILFLAKAVFSYSQNSQIRQNTISNLMFNNNGFATIIDSFINSNPLKDYIVYINIGKLNYPIVFIRIELVPLRDSNELQVLSPVGYFDLKKHVAFVIGDTCSKLFLTGTKFKKFKYAEPLQKAYNDDSNPHWVYNYYTNRDQFKLIGKW